MRKRSLSIHERTQGPERPNVALLLSNLANLYDAQGRYAEAEPLSRRSLAIYEKALGPEHPDVARLLNNLASLHCARGHYSEAEPLHKRSLSIYERAQGPELSYRLIGRNVGLSKNTVMDIVRRAGTETALDGHKREPYGRPMPSA